MYFQSMAMTLFLLIVISILAADNSSSPQIKNSDVGEGEILSFGDFTGEILPVLYVRNLPASVNFYQQLGFRFDHYFDHHTGDSVNEWKYEDSPLYAEMWAGSARFALHKASSSDSLVVGGARHYFGVTDIDVHYERVKGNGIHVGEIINRPWMRMFSVVDPDGHELYFQTRPKE